MITITITNEKAPEHGTQRNKTRNPPVKLIYETSFSVLAIRQYNALNICFFNSLKFGIYAYFAFFFCKTCCRHIKYNKICYYGKHEK